MDRLVVRLAALIVCCSALFACDDGWARPPVSDEKGEEGQNTSKKEEYARISDFITLAIATDDYLASIESGDTYITITTVSGKSITAPIKIDIVSDGDSTTGLENYIVDGVRFAEFCLGGETQSIPSDIHQKYNPPLVKKSGALNLLFIGGGFTDDATSFLPDFIKGSGRTDISLGRLLKEGGGLDDISLDSEFLFSVSSDGSDEWTEVGNLTVEEALHRSTWDVVTIMEDPLRIAVNGFDESVGRKIDGIVERIITASGIPRPSVLMMLPPSFPSDNPEVVDKFAGDRMRMFEAICAYGKSVVTGTLIDDVVSVSAAIQDLCGADAFVGNPLSCDGTRLDKGAGVFTAAGAIFCKIIETCTDLKFASNKVVSIGGSSAPGAIATTVNTWNIGACRNAIKFSVLSPFEYFDINSLHSSSHSQDIPDVGFSDSGIVFAEDGNGGGAEEPWGEEKTVSFDFAPYVSGLMPQGPLHAHEINSYAKYYSFKVPEIGGKRTFKFYNAGGCCHGADKTYVSLYDGYGTGYLGLPAVSGYKLTEITVSRANNTGAAVYLEILSDVASRTRVAGPLTWPAGYPSPDPIALSGTKENTVYYIHSLNGTYVPIDRLTLKYEKASVADAHDTDYDVFLLIGQSNMSGRGIAEESDCQPKKDVYIFTDGDETAIFGAQPLFNVESTIRKAISMQKFSLAGPFAEKVSKATGRKVLIVMNARGDTQIEAWLKNATPGSFSTADDPELQGRTMPGFYSEAVRRVKAAAKYGTIRAILWHQGEGNANIGQVPYYMPKLVRLASDLRADLGKTASELPFIVGELPYSYSWSSNLNPYLNSVSSEIENSACVSAEGCATFSETDIHFTKEALTILGERYADKYLELSGK